MTGVLGRKWLAVLALLGLIAALLAVNPDRALADAGNPDVDNPPTYSACVGPALADAGFEDIAGRSGEEAINCLAHYKIALGRSETEFAPRETISRWQMALFLSRAASIAGVVLPTEKTDPQFTDIGATSEDAQAAANRLAEAGIMPGTSTTTFSPNQEVTRGSMASMLDSFLSQATIGEGGADTTKLSPDDDVLTDITTVPRNSYISIRRIYELGITKGVNAEGTVYRPNQPVTREQMALFITRTLAHTIARPAGVSIQADKDSATGSGAEGTDGEEINFVVSVRDENYQPQVDVNVDVFSSADPDNAFDDEGACDTATTAQGGSRKCEIHGNDEQTGTSGDINLTLNVAEDTTIWAWTGDAGAKYDNDETVSAMAEIGFNKGATKLLVSHDLTDNQTKLGFGQTVNVTIQVADDDNNPVAEEGLSVGVSQTVTNAAKAGVTRSGSSSGNTRKTDASGKITLQFTQTDPTTGTAGDSDGEVVLTITDSNTNDHIVLADGEGEDPGEAQATGKETNDGMLRYSAAGMCTDGKDWDHDRDPATDDVPCAETNDTTNAARVGFTWSDDNADPVNHTLSLSQLNQYAVASEEGDGGESRVTATLTNEYGSPVSRVTVTFNSNLTNSEGENDGGLGGAELNDRQGSTGSRDGSRRINYNRDNKVGAVEIITASTSWMELLTPRNIPVVVGCTDGEDWDDDGDPATDDVPCAETDDTTESATHVYQAINADGTAKAVLGCPSGTDGACTATMDIARPEKGTDNTATFYWAAKVDETGSGTIVDRSTEDKRIIFTTVVGCPDGRADDPETADEDEACAENDDTASIAMYDDNDHFTVGEDPVTLEDFEKALDEKNEAGDAPKYDMASVSNYSDTADNVSAFTISESPSDDDS